MEETIELAWETYDFHVNIASKLESKHELAIQHYKDFMKRNLNPTKDKKNYIKKGLSKSFSTLLNVYKKNLNAVSDLIRLHENNPLEVPDYRFVEIQNLIDLRSITATLIESMEVHRSEIFEDLR